MKTHVRKIKNVLPLLHFDYRTKIVVRQWEDGVPETICKGSVRHIIAECGDCCIDKSVLIGSSLFIYVEAV